MSYEGLQAEVVRNVESAGRIEIANTRKKSVRVSAEDVGIEAVFAAVEELIPADVELKAVANLTSGKDTGALRAQAARQT